MAKLFFSHSRLQRLLGIYWKPATSRAYIQIKYFAQTLSYGDEKNRLKFSFNGIDGIGFLKTIKDNGPFWEAWISGKLTLQGDIWEAYQLISLCNGQWERYIKNLSILDAFSVLSIPYDIERDSWLGNISKVNLEVYSSKEMIKLIGEPGMWSHTYFSEAYPTPETAHEKRINGCFEFLELDKKSSYLDIGCGWGTMITSAAKKNPHLKVRGIVYNQAQHSYIEKRIRDNGLNNCSAMFGNFLEMEDKDIGVYDCISCLEMFEHIPLQDRFKAVQIVHKKLKPGGKAWFQLLLLGVDDPAQRQNAFLDSYLQKKCLPQCNPYAWSEIDYFRKFFHIRTMRWISQEDVVKSQLEWLKNLGDHRDWNLNAQQLAVICCFCALTARHNRFQVVIFELERRDTDHFLYTKQ